MADSVTVQYTMDDLANVQNIKYAAQQLASLADDIRSASVDQSDINVQFILTMINQKRNNLIASMTSIGSVATTD